MTVLCQRLWIVIVVLLAAARGTNAHVLDEYLQATLVIIEPDNIRLQINLTPGVEIAEQVVAQIDSDRNGEISKSEAATYAEMLKRDLTIRLDGRESELRLVSLNMPELADLYTGHGIIQIEFSVQRVAFSAGAHKVAIDNRHFPSIGAYLVNAARPRTASIQIARQVRNRNQSSGEIEFTYDRPPNSSGAVAVAAIVAVLIMAISAVVFCVRKATRRVRPQASDRDILTLAG